MCVYCHENPKSHHLTIVVVVCVCVCVCVCVRARARAYVCVGVCAVNNTTLCSARPHINSNLNWKCTPMVGFEIVTIVTSCSLVNMY